MFLAGYYPSLFFDHEGEGNTFFLISGLLPDYTALYPSKTVLFIETAARTRNSIYYGFLHHTARIHMPVGNSNTRIFS
jgi:hypothetical protein